MNNEKICRVCGVVLIPNINWHPSGVKHNNKICKPCSNKKCGKWKQENREHCLRYRKEQHYKNGRKPMSENKECASYLGCHVAEHVLSKIFKDVEVMPPNHSGYDFICNKGKKIDVKSACINKSGGWIFSINNNKVADDFLCLAFDNREELNPLHIWLLPSRLVNHIKNTSICESTISKWDEFRLDIDAVVDKCNEMKQSRVVNV